GLAAIDKVEAHCEQISTAVLPTAMENLPPTISDPSLLDLLGEILTVRPSVEATLALRSRMFEQGRPWQNIIDVAAGHDLIPALAWAAKQRLLLPPPPRRSTSAHAKPHVA